jgi:uncharacterized delta-60 repeat protein
MKRIVVIIFFIISTCHLIAQTGFPDPRFGVKGYINTTTPGTNANFQLSIKCFVATNGKILLVNQLGAKTILCRRLQNGPIDSSFAHNGYSEIISLIATSAAEQTDGKIVVGGSPNGSDNFMLARYKPDGNIDSSFGNNGIVIHDLGSSLDFLSDISISSDGKILAAGNSTLNGVSSFVLVRYTNSGVVDNTFGTNGIAITNFSGLNSGASAITIQNDGKILLAGKVNGSAGSDFALARYNSNGSADLNFNTTGRVSTNFDFYDRTTSVIVDNNGKIYVGGISDNGSGSRHMRITRYNANGVLDSSYNNGTGSLLLLFGNSPDDVLSKIKLQQDGSVVACGFTNLNSTASDIALVRILTNGTLDITFGNSGLVQVDISNSSDAANFLAIQNDGKIITVGYSTSVSGPFNNSYTCLRFNSNGTRDAGFGNNGIISDKLTNSFNNYSALYVQPDTKLLAVREDNKDGNGLQTFFDRFNSNGSIDNSFGQNGSLLVTSEFGFPAFQPDGKFIKFGFSPTNNGDFLILRFNPNGTPDTSFGINGSVISDFGGAESAGSIAFQPDGKIIVGGSNRSANGADIIIARYNSNGALDLGFGSSGIVRINLVVEDNVNMMAVAADGKILIAGNGLIYPPDFSFFHADILMARLNANGTLDNSFGNLGTLVINKGDLEFIGSLILQNSGKIVFSYSPNVGTPSTNYFIERLNANGTSDSSFGINGKTPCDAFLLAAQQDQKIIVSGSVVNNRNNNDLSLARYNKDGIPDSSFGINGKTIASFTGLDNYITTNLISGNLLYCAGFGENKFGMQPAILSRFLLELPPTISCPGNKTVTTDSGLCTAKVFNIDPAPVCTPNTPVKYKLSGATNGAGNCTASGFVFNKGITTVTYSLVADSTVNCTFTVNVQDKQLPKIENLATNITTLWPPDHKMVDIVLNYNAADNCGIKGTQISVTSNEPVQTNESGDKSPDWQIIDNNHIKLRAERLENGNGRVYTIKVTTTDLSDNTSSKTVQVTVPKNRPASTKLDVTVSPNPSNSQFNVTLVSNSVSPITIKVFSNNGILINTINNIAAPALLKIGSQFLPGIYYLEVNQDDITKTIKVVKQ